MKSSVKRTSGIDVKFGAGEYPSFIALSLSIQAIVNSAPATAAKDRKTQGVSEANDHAPKPLRIVGSQCDPTIGCGGR